MKVLDSDKRQVFFVDGDKLEEVTKGGRKDFLDKISNNPKIVQIAEQMAELLKGQE